MTIRFLLMGLLLLTGCRSNDVELAVTYDPLFSFPKQATFSWDREHSHVPSDPRVALLDFRGVLEETAADAFAKKGYRLTPDGGADYLLAYRITLQEILQANASRSFGAFWLDLTEAKSGRRVWTGYGRALVHVGLSEKERKSRFRKSLGNLLKDFPPSQR